MKTKSLLITHWPPIQTAPTCTRNVGDEYSRGAVINNEYEYEYEPLDELIATPPFTRCACYYRYPRLPSYALPGCKVTPIEPLKLIYPNSTLASLARQIQSSRA